MTKADIVRHLLKQSPFLTFRAADLQRIERRLRSSRYVYVRFGYQWKDAHGHSRKEVASALKGTLKNLFEEVRAQLPSSRHALNYATLRAEVGQPVLHRIVRDIFSADLLLFDLTHLNANVLFELGIAYAIGRRIVVLMCEGANTDLPSDLAGLTYCRYKAPGLCLGTSAHSDLRALMRQIVREKMGPGHQS